MSLFDGYLSAEINEIAPGEAKFINEGLKKEFRAMKQNEKNCANYIYKEILEGLEYFAHLDEDYDRLKDKKITIRLEMEARIQTLEKLLGDAEAQKRLEKIRKGKTPIKLLIEI